MGILKKKIFYINISLCVTKAAKAIHKKGVHPREIAISAFPSVVVSCDKPFTFTIKSKIRNEKNETIKKESLELIVQLYKFNSFLKRKHRKDVPHL